MKLLSDAHSCDVSGGIDSITPQCFDVVNLYAQWWFYGLITPETFTATFTGNCSPDSIVIIDSTTLDIIACVPEKDVLTVLYTCYN